MQGIFKYCSKCQGNKNCCTDFEDIDNPIIYSNEKELIQQIIKCNDEIFTKIEKDCYNINTINGVCPFYKNGCAVYNVRPNDCRLYPYDIKVIDGKYYLIRYKLKCLKGCAVDEDVDDIVKDIQPYIETYANETYNQKLKLVDYEIIREIKG